MTCMFFGDISRPWSFESPSPSQAKPPRETSFFVCGPNDGRRQISPSTGGGVEPGIGSGGCNLYTSSPDGEQNKSSIGEQRRV